MTVEEPNAPVAVEETPVTETKAIEETNVTGNKRAFDEIQARAAVTIHDLADEVRLLRLPLQKLINYIH